MTNGHAFDLEPAAPQDKGRGKRRPPRPATRGAGEGLGRWFGWLVSPIGFYLFGFFTVLGLLLALFNPDWGALGRGWPHVVLAGGDRPFEWGAHQAWVAALLAVLAGYTIALLMPAGPKRGGLVVLATVLALVAFQPPADGIPIFVVPLAMALTVGALLCRPRGDAGAARRRTALLIFGLSLLAANQFLPWDSNQVGRKGLPPGYYCTAVSTIDYYVNPPELFMREHRPGDTGEVGGGYGRMILMHVTPTAALLIFLFGLVALLGWGGRWAGWAGALSILLACLGTMWVINNEGRISSSGLLETWQAGLQKLADVWHKHALAYALPLAAGLAELVRGRRA